MTHRRTCVAVLGTGRSGTSTVARLLEDRLGVAMGTSYIPANEHNPQGFFEDSWQRLLNRRACRDELQPWQWALETLKGKPRLFGWKDPKAAFLPPECLDELAMLCRLGIVVAARPRALVVPSMARFDGCTAAAARRMYEARLDGLNRLLHKRSHLVVDFSSAKSDDDVLQELQPWLLSLQDARPSDTDGAREARRDRPGIRHQD